MDGWRRGCQELELICWASQFPMIYTMGTTLTASLLPNPPPCSRSSIPYRKLSNTCRKLSLLLYLLMDPMTDIWLSESQCAGAGMANLESEANLEVCACKRKKKGRRKKIAQIRAKVAELQRHSCPWSTVVVKTRKKMDIPLSVMNKSLTVR